MDNKNKHIKNSFESYLRYFRNLLSGKERNRFERNVMKDDFEQEAFEGLSQLEGDQLASDMEELKKRVAERTVSRKITFKSFLKYAAAAVLVLSIGTTIYLVRESARNVSMLAVEQAKEDTTLSKNLPAKKMSDTLNKNIAWVSESETDEKPLNETRRLTKKTIPVPAQKITAVKTDIESAEEKDLDYNAESMHQELIAEEPETADQTVNTYIMKSAGNETGQSGYTNMESRAFAVPETQDESMKKKAMPLTLAGTDKKEAKAMEDIVVIIGYNLSEEKELVSSERTARSDKVKAESSGSMITNPSPSVGLEGYNQYFEKNIRYNKLPATEEPVFVTLRFIVNSNGSVADIETVESPGKDFEKEAIRLIEEGPAWVPAFNEGNFIPVKVTLKVKFQRE